MNKKQKQSASVEKKPACEIDGVKYVVSCHYPTIGESAYRKIQEAIKSKASA